MNTIYGNYNYNNSYNRYPNYGSGYGSGLNFGNVFNVANQANVAGNAYLAPNVNSDNTNSGNWFSNLVHGSVLGSIGSWAGRAWGALSNNTINAVRGMADMIRHVASWATLGVSGWDIYNAYQTDKANGVNPLSWDSATVRQGLPSIVDNSAAILCGLGVGALTVPADVSTVGISTPAAYALSAAAATGCYYGADKLTDAFFDKVDEIRGVNQNVDYGYDFIN